MFKVFAFIAAAALATAVPAHTTSAPTGSAGLAGLLGGVLPRIGSVGAGNAAGLLGYCLKNNLLGATGAASAAGTGGGLLDRLLGGSVSVPNNTPTATAVLAPTPVGSVTGARATLERLLSRPGVQQSAGYKAGEAGQVQTGSSRTLGLDGVQGQLKTQMCKLVLDRAKSFL